MIRLTIDINGKIINQSFAVNISDSVGIDYGKGEQLYEHINITGGIQDKLTNIRHDYDKGAIELAIKMLEDLKNEKTE